ncbi:MAG: zf-HC2 domain-containing protein [Anaerolineae bacterium]|jgi:hypothetical protein
MSWSGTQKQTDHRQFEEQLSAYLDGELLPREQEAVEQHLATCSACRWNLETLRQTVQWTSELPAVRVPRTFMIPVPAQPARATRRWRLVPLLQMATALVGLLLFFFVAGDMLTGFLPRSTPEPQVVSLSSEATMQVEAPEATAMETVVVEKEAEGLMAQEAPEAEASDATEGVAKMLQVAPDGAATVTAIAAIRATGAPAGMGGGTEESEVAAAEAAPADVQRAEATLALEAPAMPPTPTALPTLAPEPTVASMAPPPAPVAEGEELSGPGSLEESERGYGQQPTAMTWLRWVEYVLGVLLIVLVGATIGAMVWRRSRG